MRNPFRYFNSSPEIIRLTVMMYVRFPLSLRQVEHLLHMIDSNGDGTCSGDETHAIQTTQRFWVYV